MKGIQFRHLGIVVRQNVWSPGLGNYGPNALPRSQIVGSQLSAKLAVFVRLTREPRAPEVIRRAGDAGRRESSPEVFSGLGALKNVEAADQRAPWFAQALGDFIGSAHGKTSHERA